MRPLPDHLRKIGIPEFGSGGHGHPLEWYETREYAVYQRTKSYLLQEESRTVYYRGYHINRDTPMPWTFGHEEYDGAIDSKDRRAGGGDTLQDCIDQIDEIEEGDEA